MTALTRAATTTAGLRARTRTGGPRDDGPDVLEHALGWLLVVVVAVFVTGLGLL